jgi:ketosteroid isomerase-like protein
MASADVEVARAFFRAYAERGLEPALEYIHPEFEMTTPPEQAAEPDTYRGHDGLRRYFGSFDDVMDEVELDVWDLQDVGGGVVRGIIRLTATGRASGIRVELDNVVFATTVSEGKVIRIDFYPDPEDAPEAPPSGA